MCTVYDFCALLVIMCTVDVCCAELATQLCITMWQIVYNNKKLCRTMLQTVHNGVAKWVVS